MNEEIKPKVLYKITAYDSDFIKETPDKTRTINGSIYYYYDFKKHRYLSQFISDDFNIYEELKNMQCRIIQLQNNWNELKKWLEKQKEIGQAQEHYMTINICNLILREMQELEGK